MMRLPAYELGNTVLAFVAERRMSKSGVFWFFLDDRRVRVDIKEITSHGVPNVIVKDEEGTPYTDDVGAIVDQALAEQGTWGLTTTSPAIYQHLAKTGTFEGPKGARIYRRGERAYQVLFR